MAIANLRIISLVDVKTGEERVLLNSVTACINRIAWLNSGRIIACCWGSVELWRIDSQESKLRAFHVGVNRDLDAFGHHLTPSSSSPLQVAISNGRNIGVWRIDEDSESTRFCLIWGLFANRLVAKGTDITGAIGLNKNHRQLLVQHSATDKSQVQWMKSQRCRHRGFPEIPQLARIEKAPSSNT